MRHRADKAHKGYKLVCFQTEGNGSFFIITDYQTIKYFLKDRIHTIRGKVMLDCDFMFNKCYLPGVLFMEVRECSRSRNVTLNTDKQVKIVNGVDEI